MLASDDGGVFLTQGGGPFGVALGQVTGPGLVGLVAREQAQEVGTRHARVTHAQLHDGAFLLAQAIQGTAYALNQNVELLGHQLDRHEQVGQRLHGADAVFMASTVLLQHFEGIDQLILDCTKTLGGNDRVRTAFGLFLVVAIGVLFVFFVAFFLRGSGLGTRDWYFFGRCGDVVVRVDVTAEDVGKTAAFGGDTVVFAEDVVDSTREVSDGAHDFTDAFLDTLGDFDLAFAGQQLDGTHFAHVHAHRVGRAADIGLDSRQCGGGLFGCGLVSVGFRQQQGIRIRSTLEYVDPHVVDHADDVFHLLRI